MRVQSQYVYKFTCKTLTPTKCRPSLNTIMRRRSSCSTRLADPGRYAGTYPYGTPDGAMVGELVVLPRPPRPRPCWLDAIVMVFMGLFVRNDRQTDHFQLNVSLTFNCRTNFFTKNHIITHHTMMNSTAMIKENRKGGRRSYQARRTVVVMGGACIFLVALILLSSLSNQNQVSIIGVAAAAEQVEISPNGEAAVSLLH